MKKLRVGIAGFGVVGKRRRLCIDAHPLLETVAISDRQIKSGTMDDGVLAFESFEELFHIPLDVVFVCLPNKEAPLATIMALQAGCHVFCEKPPGKSVEDILEVIKVEKKNPNLKLKYGFNHRYHDSVKEALGVIERNELGAVINLKGVYGKSKIVSFTSDWRTKRNEAGGGILLDQGIHMLDMMRLFAGEFTEVHSFVSNSFWNHDVEDNAYALMKSDRGVIGMIHSSATLWRHSFRLEITLEKGSITLSGILSGSKSYGAETITIAQKSETDDGDPMEKTLRYNQDNSWKEEVNEFALAISDNLPILNGNSLDALNTMSLVNKIYTSDPAWKKKFQLKEIDTDVFGNLNKL